MDDREDLPTVEEVERMSRSNAMATDYARKPDEDRRYAVKWIDSTDPDRDGRPVFLPQMTDEELAAREGVGAPCDGCGVRIRPDAIIIRDTRDSPTKYYHVGCRPEQ